MMHGPCAAGLVGEVLQVNFNNFAIKDMYSIMYSRLFASIEPFGAVLPRAAAERVNTFRHTLCNSL